MNRLRERRVFIQGRDQFAVGNIRGNMVGYDLRNAAAVQCYVDQGGKLLPAKVRAILDDWVPKLRTVLSQIAA